MNPNTTSRNETTPICDVQNEIEVMSEMAGPGTTTSNTGDEMLRFLKLVSERFIIWPPRLFKLNRQTKESFEF